MRTFVSDLFFLSIRFSRLIMYQYFTPSAIPMYDIPHFVIYFFCHHFLKFNFILKYRRQKSQVLDLWVEKIPWRRTWQSTPAFLPGESHGEKSLAGHSL